MAMIKPSTGQMQKFERLLLSLVVTPKFESSCNCLSLDVPPKNRPSFNVKLRIEEWGKEYNRIRPHSALGYRPSAPEAIIPITLT